MNCQKCNLPVDDGAAFCGNCGQAQYRAPIAEQLPSYAATKPNQHKGEVKALLSVLFGVIGTFGALFMAVIGLILGVLGLIMGSMSRNSHKRKLSSIGIGLSCISLITGIGVWVYVFNNDPSLNNKTVAADEVKVESKLASELSTPCYSFGFAEKLKVTHKPSSCNMNAFNGKTIDTSSLAYKVYASQSEVTTTEGFNTLAKKAIIKDINETLPSFTIGKQGTTTFAGSPAYAVYVYDKKNNVSLVEAAVFHKTSTGENIFILVHAINNDKVDLQLMESQWQWK